MDISKFTDKKTGRLEKISGINVTHCFVPNELPPRWKVSDRLWPLIVEARAAIASLNGIGKHLPNPQLLLNPLQHREAQLSSQLEGTITDPQQQLLFEMKLPLSEKDDENISALREVSNYRRALLYHLKNKKGLPLSLRLIRELHGVLLTGVRGGDHDPGNFRRVQVQIGKPARYVPPAFNLVLPLLDNLEKYIHAELKYDPLVNSFIVHYQFEAIHPFRDGNGRVGRLLLAIMIADGCNLSHNWLYMSAFFDANRDEYIDRLFNVSARGDWDGWIEFCLHGAIKQAQDTELRCSRLLDVSGKFKERLNNVGGSHRLTAIADSLFTIPVIQIPVISETHNVSYPTAKSDIEKLVEAGILKELTDQRPKTYYSEEIFELIYADF